MPACPDRQILPYTSTQDGFETGDANLWLTRSLLNTFILARRAGWKVDMPREYTDWQAHPLLLLPSPLTSTERNLVHVHTSFLGCGARLCRPGRHAVCQPVRGCRHPRDG